MTKGHQIALWDDALRTLPTAFARSALFRVAGKGERKNLKGEIAASEGIRIKYRGEELRTDDEEVLMLVLHKLRGRDWKKPEDLVVETTRHEMLRELDRPSDGRYYAELTASLERMSTGGLVVSYRGTNGRRYGMTQTVIRKWAYAEDEKPEGKGRSDARIKIWLEPEVMQFFSDHSESERFSIVWQERASLGKPLAKWLHSHLHAIGFGIADHVVCRVDVLWRLSGSEASTLKSFKTILQRTLKEMQKAEVIGNSMFRQDLLCVTRPGTDAGFEWVSAAPSAGEPAFPVLDFGDAEDTDLGELEEAQT